MLSLVVSSIIGLDPAATSLVSPRSLISNINCQLNILAFPVMAAIPLIHNEDFLTEDEAYDMFNEAISAISQYLNRAGVADYLKSQSTDSDGNPFTGNDKYILGRSWKETTYSTLGFCCIAYPYERYTKLQKLNPNKRLPVANVFGFLGSNDVDGSQFQRTFPGSLIHTWDPDKVLTAGVWKTEPSTWFIRCLRNSFAHGQSSVVNVAGMDRLRIWNTPDRGANIDFDVSMALDEFASLIKSLVTHAMHMVLEDGRYSPLDKLVSKDWNA